MLQCTGRCARRYTRSLESNLIEPNQHLPLLFLYPQWYRRRWVRHQHTETAHLQKDQDQGKKRGDLKAHHQDSNTSTDGRDSSLRSTRDSKQSSTVQKRPIHTGPPNKHDLHKGSSRTIRTVFVTPRELKVKDATDHGTRILWNRNADKHLVGRNVQKIPSLSRYNPSQLQIDLMIRLLLKEFPYPEVSPQHSLSISTRVLFRLTGAKNSNTWIYGAGSDCLIKVFPTGSSDSDRHPVVLTGSSRAQELATQFLLQAEQQISENLFELKSTSNLESLEHVRQIPEPNEWNVRTLSEYVETIVHLPRRQNVEHFLYSGTSYHLEASKALKHVFGRQELKYCFSSHALTQALRFCRKHSELTSSGTYLLAQAKQVGLAPDISVVNEQIGSALLNNNAAKFLLLVEDMKQSGIHPNKVTWATMIDYATSRDQVTELLAELKSRGFLQSTDDAPTIARAVIKQEFPFYVEQNDGVRKMKAELDQVFGDGWLTPRAITQMLDVCRLKESHLNAAYEVLQLAKEAEGQGLYVNVQGVKRLLQIANKKKSVEGVVNILKLKSLSKNRSEDEAVCELAFKIAWKRRAFNVSKLIWRYAASAGIITRFMQRKVKIYLIRNTVRSEGEDSRDAWQLLAGKVMVGTNLDMSDFDDLFKSLSKEIPEKKLNEWLLRWTPDNGQRNDQMMLAHLLIERDMNAWRFYRKMSWDCFLTLLDQARKLDLEWQRNGTPNSLSPVDVLKNSLQIPLERRDQPFTFTGEGLEYPPLRKSFVINGINLDINTLTQDKPPGDGDDDNATAVASGV